MWPAQTVEDILLREELEAFARAHGDRVRVWHVVVRIDEEQRRRGWPFSTGMISADILRQHLPPPAVHGGAEGKKEGEERPQQQPAIFLCGPPGLERAARKMLGELGHPPERLADF